MPEPFEDVATERAVVAGVLRHGFDGYIDCADLVTTNHFNVGFNQYLWRCVEEHYKAGDAGLLDLPSMRSIAKRLGFAGVFEDKDTIKHLRAVTAYHAELPTVRREAQKLYTLRVGRALYETVTGAAEKLTRITGDESLDELHSMVEQPVFDFIRKMDSPDDGTGHIADGVDEWLDDIERHPVQNIGIPSPFARYNAAIGGGFRRGTVTVLAARSKVGKSIWGDNSCLHVAGNMQMPVLNLDTEMSRDEHRVRVLACMAGIDSLKIEKGELTREEMGRLRGEAARLKAMPYHYESMVGAPMEEHVAFIRRWVYKHVPMGDDGRRRPALVLYDWLQVADPGHFAANFKEHQILGFYTGWLLGLASQCDVSVVALTQLSRDFQVADSDKIARRCSSLTHLLRKDPEDSDFDHGKLKMEIQFARHGPGLLQGDAINVKFDGATSRMEEGPTRYELEKAKKRKQDGFEMAEGPQT